jgi:hypothetical protein
MLFSNKNNNKVKTLTLFNQCAIINHTKVKKVKNEKNK